jgi:hypothetical protein
MGKIYMKKKIMNHSAPCLRVLSSPSLLVCNSGSSATSSATRSDGVCQYGTAAAGFFQGSSAQWYCSVGSAPDNSVITSCLSGDSPSNPDYSFCGNGTGNAGATFTAGCVVGGGFI